MARAFRALFIALFIMMVLTLASAGPKKRGRTPQGFKEHQKVKKKAAQKKRVHQKHAETVRRNQNKAERRKGEL